MLEQPESIQSELELIHEKLYSKEIKLTAELNELFKGQTKLLANMSALEPFTPNIPSLQENILELKSLVDSTSELAEGVCRRVRKSDEERNAVSKRLENINDIIDIKVCRDGVFKAMQKELYEEAAIHIKRFLSINEKDLQQTLNTVYQQGETKRSMEANCDDLKSACDDLKSACDDLNSAKYDLLKIIGNQLALAIMEDDSRGIERFFKIFPLINEHIDGLKRYAKYLSDKLTSSPSLKDILNCKNTSQADKLAALYENVAKLIDSHQPFVETYYGPGYLLVIVKTLQKECDKLTRKLLEEFRDASKLQFIVKSISTLDPRDIDNVLNEITIIISRTEVYLNFIIDKTKEDIQVRYEDKDEREAKLLDLYNQMNIDCELSHLVQELGGIYVRLEQYYLHESSRKAIDMDELDKEASCVTSSMLDDVFFIIKKCTQRALSTKSSDVFCAVNNHCVTLLDTTFVESINDRLKNRYPLTDYICAINNLDKAEDYINRLRSMLEIGVKKLRVSSLHIHQKDQSEKLSTPLNELLQINRRFRAVISSALYRLYSSTIGPRLKTVLDTMLDENPEIVEEHTSKKELSRLVSSLISSIDPSLKTLTERNFSELVTITQEFVDCHIKKLKQMKK